MTYKVSVYVPTDCLFSEAAIEYVAVRLCQEWGGCTVLRGYGFWMDNALNKLVSENVAVCYTLTDSTLAEVRRLGNRLAEHLRVWLDQVSVLWTIEDAGEVNYSTRPE